MIGRQLFECMSKFHVVVVFFSLIVDESTHAQKQIESAQAIIGCFQNVCYRIIFGVDVAFGFPCL